MLALLKRCQQKNIKLNKDKFKFKCDEVSFIGDTLTQNGLNIDPAKVEAITKMSKPEGVAGVQRFIGMVKHLAKFLPRLSEVCEPLRNLTHKDAPWVWGKDHNKFFAEIQKAICEAPVQKARLMHHQRGLVSCSCKRDVPLYAVADDALVTGRGETYEEAVKNHDMNMLALLKRCQQKNIKLNKDKFKFKCDEVSFIGDTLTQNGLNIDPAKVEAITKMSKPEGVAGVQRFIGMVKHLAKFLPRLSEVCEPLRNLTHKDAPWQKELAVCDQRTKGVSSFSDDNDKAEDAANAPKI
eukprot:gene14832-5949_t